MKVGYLVRRKFTSEEQKQRVFQFNSNVRDYGIVTKVDKEKEMVVVVFNGDTEHTVLPLSGDYLEIVSDVR